MSNSLQLRVMLGCVAALCGASSVLQAGVNVSLGSALSSSGTPNMLAAGLVSFSVGTALLLMLNALHCIATQCDAPPSPPRRWWELAGGALGSTIMTCTLLSTPQIGFALLSVMRVGGNLVSASVMDHHGVMGIER